MRYFLATQGDWLVPTIVYSIVTMSVIMSMDILHWHRTTTLRYQRLNPQQRTGFLLDDQEFQSLSKDRDTRRRLQELYIRTKLYAGVIIFFQLINLYVSVNIYSVTFAMLAAVVVWVMVANPSIFHLGKILPVFDEDNAVPATPALKQELFEDTTLAFEAEIAGAPPEVRAIFERLWKEARRRFAISKLHGQALEEEFTQFYRTLTAALSALTNQLPKSSSSSSTMPLTIPLPEYLGDTAPVGEMFRSLPDNGFYAGEWTRYKENKAALEEAIKRKSVAKDDTTTHFRYLLNGTIFSGIEKTQVAFSYNPESRFEGQWIVAPPKRGKTTLLHWQLFNDIKSDATIILMDSKGDLIDPLRSVKFQSDVIVIDPSVDRPLALNPLDIGGEKGDQLATYRTITLLEGLFSTLSSDAKLTPLQSTLFHGVLTLLISAVPNPTIFTFRDILTNGYKKYQQYIDLLPDVEAREFFSKQEFDSDRYKATKSEVLWRLKHIITNPVLRAMFNSHVTKVNMGQLMDSGSLILINANKALLGEEGAEFYQRFFITLILAAAQQRAGKDKRDKRPVYLYIDECHTAIRNEAKIATIINECRSQRIGLTLAHQSMQQIKSPDVLAALSDCAIRIANSDEEASHLAPRMRSTPEKLRSLPVGSFAVFVRDTTPESVILSIPMVDPRKMPQLTESQMHARDVDMRARYSAPKTPRYEPDPDTPSPAPIDTSSGQW